MFLTRVLDLGNLLLTDALTEPIGLQAFEALFDASHFGEATSSTLPKMARGSVEAGEVEQSWALGCHGLDCCSVSWEMRPLEIRLVVCVELCGLFVCGLCFLEGCTSEI